MDPTLIGNALLTFGPTGIAVAIGWWLYVTLRQENKDERAAHLGTIEKAQTRIDAVTEARLQDHRAAREQAAERIKADLVMAQSLNELTKMVERLAAQEAGK